MGCAVGSIFQFLSPAQVFGPGWASAPGCWGKWQVHLTWDSKCTWLSHSRWLCTGRTWVLHQGGFEESDNLKRLTVAELVTDRNHYRNILQPSLTNSFIDWLTNTFTCIKKSHIKGAGVHELEDWSRATSFRVSWYHATSLQVTQPLLSRLWSDIIKIIRQMRHQTWDIVKSCKLDFGH